MAAERRTSILLTLVFIITFTSSSPAGEEVSWIDLSNGLTLLAMEDHASPLVALGVFYHVGTKNECAGMTGITKICENIIQEGTPSFDRGEFSRIIQSAGGWTGSSTNLDISQFSTKIPSAMLDTALYLEADRMENIELTFEKLMLAKDAVRKDRLAYVESSIYGYINEEILNLSFRSHPYQYPRYGWPTDIAGISMDDLKEYFRLYFQPANATLVIVGDFNTDLITSRVRLMFEDIASTPLPERKTIVEPAQVGERYEYIEGFTGIPVFIIGYHVPEITHKDMLALNLISTILTGGESSRAFKRMVIDEKSALAVGGGILKTEDPSLFYSYAILNYDSPVSAGEAQMNEEINRLKNEHVADSELEKAKNRTEADYYRHTRSLNDKVSMIGFYHQAAGDWKLMKSLVKDTRAVSKEDILAAARKYFQKSNRTVVFLQPAETMPMEDAEGLE